LNCLSNIWEIQQTGYRISPGDYEAIYSGMPSIGLGAAHRLVAAEGGREAARLRMRNPIENHIT
jgi:hypothetical protein